MRDEHVVNNEFELLPTSQSQQSIAGGSIWADERKYEDPSGPLPAQYTRRRTKWLPFTETKELVAFTLVLVCSVPIRALVVSAPRLSSRLSGLACLPNGEFVFPGTVSIWNPKHFFVVTLPLGTSYGSNWGYTRVKIIDAVWDVLAGRGAQLILIWIAYRVFHKSLLYLMQTQPIPYRAYGAAAFDTGQISSIFPYIAASLSREQKTSTKARRIYTSLALTTIYIVAMPTLFAAMAGYAAMSTPLAETVPTVGFVDGPHLAGAVADYCQISGPCTITPCATNSESESGGAGLIPLWAIVLDMDRLNQTVSGGFMNFISPELVITDFIPGSFIYQYYLKHKSDYDAAAKSPNCISNQACASLDDCQPLQKPSFFRSESETPSIDLSSPMLNIEVIGTDSQGIPNAFQCDNGFYPVPIFRGKAEQTKRGTHGVCTAGPYYQWGFSYLLTLIVSIANFLFAAMLYGLWLNARRNGNVRTVVEVVHTGETTLQGLPNTFDRNVNYPNHLRSALHIAEQAERQHGCEIHEWPSWRLDKEVWHGKQGLRFGDVGCSSSTS